MTLLSLLPVFPLYYNGDTKFSPIHAFDFCEIILKIIDKNIIADIIECVGPENLSFREIIKKLLKSIDKKRFLFPIPLTVAKIIAFLFERFPKPLITQDQLRLLKYDNILSEKNKSNIDIGFEAKLKFDQEIRKYSYMWKKGGEYSR
jgi:NADH dehydrogenase